MSKKGQDLRSWPDLSNAVCNGGKLSGVIRANRFARFARIG